jgi:glutathione S-transferase
MLTIYGTKQSRAGRCLWALEELGLAYQHNPVNPHTGGTRNEAYLKLNPLGKVPTLTDGDFVLTESVAICYYLASKQPTPLWPDDLQARARIYQCSSWATTELEFHLTMWIREKRGNADAALMTKYLENAAISLSALEIRLTASPYVAGASFTIGDINAASSLAMGAALLDMSAFPASKAWLEKCLARPAWQKVQTLD